LQLREQYNQIWTEHNGDLNAVTAGPHRPLTLFAQGALLVLAPPRMEAENEIEKRDHIRRALTRSIEHDRAAPHHDCRFVAFAVVAASKLPVAGGEQKRRTDVRHADCLRN
jgi:hypothetical protein